MTLRHATLNYLHDQEIKAKLDGHRKLYPKEDKDRQACHLCYCTGISNYLAY